MISLIALAAAVFALYRERLTGAWRWVYVVSAVLALYLNVFVGVVQAFQKLPFLHRLAPTQSEPPFLVAQLVVMAIFILLGFLSDEEISPLDQLSHSSGKDGSLTGQQCDERRSYQ